MNIQSTYHKFVSLATIALMLWNIVGWLGFGLMLDHSHANHGSQHCEVTFCYCEIEEGEKICTCHHNNMNGTDHHSSKTDTEHDGDYCYYSAPHTDSQTASEALVNIAKIHAFYLNSSDYDFSLSSQEYHSERPYRVAPGTIPDLLRPPRV